MTLETLQIFTSIKHLKLELRILERSLHSLLRTCDLDLYISKHKWTYSHFVYIGTFIVNLVIVQCYAGVAT
jgi:hypothetical protein